MTTSRTGSPRRFRGTAWAGWAVAAVVAVAACGTDDETPGVTVTAAEPAGTSTPASTTSEDPSPTSTTGAPATTTGATTTTSAPAATTSGDEPPTDRSNCVYSGGGWLCAGPPPTSASSTRPVDAAEGSGCTPPAGQLPDGVWYGLIEDGTAEAVEFDLACWFTGEAAAAAALEDGEESPPPNDYYVRNANSATRTVPVADGATALSYPSGSPEDEQTGPFADYLQMAATRGYSFGVWIAVEDGHLTELREQWVP